MDAVKRNIMLRHLNGSRANRIDQFELVEGLTVQLGRKPGSDVLYDSTRDDLVSRQHATIALKNLEGPSVFITDNGSSNGTFVNGKALTGEQELFPDDVVELGKNGSKFVFDIQPRPEAYAARTRVMSAVDAATTRVMSTGEAAAAATGQTGAATGQGTAAPAKVGVGKETVERLLFEERKSTRKSWSAVVAGLAAFIVVGGGGLYWYSAHSAQKLREEAAAASALQAQEAAKAKQEALASVSRELGASARQIVEKYGDATVQISMQWGLYDRETGKPLFLKSFVVDGQRYPAFVQLKDGDIVPWLTIEDGARTNFKMGGRGTGSGFVIRDNGFILSNKHVVAGWMTNYDWPGEQALVFTEAKAPNAAPGKFKKGDVSDYSWKPEQESRIVFLDRTPFRISDSRRSLIGRNEELEVRFPGSRLGMTATLVRASTDADAALIKVDTPQNLGTVTLSDQEKITVGERVTVLGYPGVSIQEQVRVTIREAGQATTRTEVIPQPTVTEGIISKVSQEDKQVSDNIRAVSEFGPVFQLGINTTGSGNSGGPVFDSTGNVIGLFTYGLSRGGARVSLAVPIKYGSALLQAQRTQ